MKYLIVLLLLIPVVFLLSSCTYSNYYHLSEDYEPGVYNKDSTLFAFGRSMKVFQRASGINKFPDGGFSKFLCFGMDIYIFDFENHQLMHIDKLKLSNDALHYMFSVDGKYLIYSYDPLTHYWNDEQKKFKPSYYNEYSGIYLYNIDQKEKKKISDTGENPQFSPNGQFIVFSDFSSNIAQLYIYDIKNGTQKVLTEGYYPVYSPDGTKIAFVRRIDEHMYRINIIDLQTKKLRNVKEVKFLNRFATHWLDNDNLYFQRRYVYNFTDDKVVESKDVKIEYHKRPFPTGVLPKNIPYSAWQFNIFDCYPVKDKQQIVNDIASSKSGSVAFRLHLLKAYSKNLTREDIEYIRKKIMEKRETITGYRRSSYDKDMKEFLEILDKLEAN